MGSQISSLVFQPPEVTYSHTKRPLVWLKTTRNTQIPAFYLDRQAKITFLFSHGNAEDLGTIYEWFVLFSAELRVNLIAYDYEGYGKATGYPSESNCYEDIEIVYNHLTETLGILPENIILYGRSLGSGPSIYLAEKLSKCGIQIGGLILQSPLLSIFRVAFPFRFTLPGDMFANIDRIRNVLCPIWVIHGTKDEVVPFWNGEQLFLASPISLRAKPFWIDGGGHNNLEIFFRDELIFFDQFREFLYQWVPSYGQTYSSFYPDSFGFSNPSANLRDSISSNSSAGSHGQQYSQRSKKKGTTGGSSVSGNSSHNSSFTSLIGGGEKYKR